jgi:hypothetical protein
MIGAILPLLIPVVLWLRTPIHQGLDLATDVTAYFRGRSWASSAQHRTDERLKTRFRAAVQNLLEDGVDRLVVVAHSQGTVIAVDALRGSADGSQVDVNKVDLLTMGSPLRSLYAQFFPDGFGKLIGNGAPKVRSWVNLFRADDYVGQSLDLKHTGIDRQIDGQGHEHYWTDASVLEEIEKLMRA